MAWRVELLEERSLRVFEVDVFWERKWDGRREESRNVLRRGAGDGAHGEEAVCSSRSVARNRSRHAEDVTILLKGEVGGDERAGFLGRFDDDRRATEAGDEPIPQWEVMLEPLRSGPEFADECSARLEDPLRQRQIRSRVDRGLVDPRAEDRQTGCARADACLMHDRIDSSGESGHDGDAVLGELLADPLRDALSVWRVPPRPDDGDGLSFAAFEASSYKERNGRIRDLTEQRGIVVVRDQNKLDTHPIERLGELRWIGA